MARLSLEIDRNIQVKVEEYWKAFIQELQDLFTYST
jgi:hypothetical protein